MTTDLIERLRELGTVRLNEPMSRHVTFGVGGPADVYFVAENEEALRQAYALARSNDVPVFIFGSGSNILVGDKGVRGLTIENRTDTIDGPVQNGAGLKVRVASGVSFATLARRMASAGYSGVEWACGIPGSLGGAVVTNAGAYDWSLADVVRGARLSAADGTVMELTPDDLQLSYRNSAFTRGELRDAIVLSVDLRLDHGDASELKARVKEMDAARKAAQPPGRNCGSVFKNPPDHSSWWYVDKVGLRGHRIGNAQVSAQHSNFILNLGNAQASDITALVDMAKERVREQFGVELETEVMMVGEFG
jgi:UDP-N-acetylmuramate dehydrogenase